MRITKEFVLKRAIKTAFILSAILIIYGIFSSETTRINMKNNRFNKISVDWRMSVDGGQEELVILPYKTQDKTAGTVYELTTMLPYNIQDNEELFFKADNQCVRVYVEDEIIYEFGYDEDRKFGKTPGDALIIVDLDSRMSGKHCTIEVCNVYDSSYSRIINNVYIGDKNSILSYMISKNFVALCICIILLVAGLFMLICCMFAKNDFVLILKRLSIFAISISIWTGFMTDIYQIGLKNAYLCSNMEFLVFSCLAPVFMWFLLSLKQYKNDKILEKLFYISVIEVTLINVLQYFDITDYIESIIATHIVLVITGVYLVYSAVRNYIKSEEKSFISLMSTIILLLSAFMDLFRYYFTDDPDVGFFMRLGLFVFIFIWFVNSLKQMTEYYTVKTEKKIMERMAFIDVMTGLKNRNSYMNEAELYRKGDIKDDTCIVLIDMNNLKKINDTFGHGIGDMALIMVSKVLKKGFLKEGNCYRMGGDEFVYLIKNQSVDNVRKEMDRLSKEIIKRCESEIYECSIAYGISIICEDNNYDIEKAYSEADEEMYVHKNAFKEKYHKAGK